MMRIRFQKSLEIPGVKRLENFPKTWSFTNFTWRPGDDVQKPGDLRSA